MSADYSKEEKLLEILSPNSTTTVKEIAARLYVSEATARRYVNALAKSKKVIRTHGGCMPSAAVFDNNTPMYIRFSSETEEKSRIAQRAAALVEDGATLFLDSSSSAYHLIPYLAKKQNLTVVTSGIKTAAHSAQMNIRTVCLGGFVDAHNLSSNSALAIKQIGLINADIFFFSCDALSDSGELTDNSCEESILRREFMKYAKRSILLIDSTKLHKKCRYNLCTLDDIDSFISSADIKEDK